jgi:hypothetical protein
VKGARIEVLDDRLRTKEYGKRVAKYLEGMIGLEKRAIAADQNNQSGSIDPRATDVAPQGKAAGQKGRKEEGQMKLL